MSYTFDEVYKFLMQCPVDDRDRDEGYDDYSGNCTEEITWTREAWIYNIDDVTYTVAWVEDFLEKNESFVEIAVYADSFFDSDFYARKEKNGTLTVLKNDKTLLALDIYRMKKTLEANLHNKDNVSAISKTKI